MVSFSDLGYELGCRWVVQVPLTVGDSRAHHRALNRGTPSPQEAARTDHGSSGFRCDHANFAALPFAGLRRPPPSARGPGLQLAERLQGGEGETPGASPTACRSAILLSPARLFQG